MCIYFIVHIHLFSHELIYSILYKAAIHGYIEEQTISLKNLICPLILLFQTIKHFMLSIFNKVDKQKLKIRKSKESRGVVFQFYIFCHIFGINGKWKYFQFYIFCHIFGINGKWKSMYK